MAEIVVRDHTQLHIGEAETARELTAGLPADWVVFTNLLIPHRRHPRELDLVVLADRHVFVVEVKHHRGRIAFAKGQMTQNGQYRKSPLVQVEEATKVLMEYLQTEVPDAKNLRGRPIRGHVVLSHPSNGSVEMDAVSRLRVSVLADAAADLVAIDRSRDSGNERVVTLRSAYRNALDHTEMREGIPDNLGSYEVLDLDVVASDPSTRVFNARHEDGSEWLLKLHRPKEHLDADATSRERKAFEREYDALTRLASHGVAPRVERYQRLDSGELLVPIATSTARRLSEDIAEDRLPDAQTLVAVVAASYRALAVVHGCGVTHRAITPERVAIDADGHVLFTEFHVAHIDSMTGNTSLLPDHDGVDVKYWRAPEAKEFLTAAVPASDVWALATSLRAWVLGNSSSKVLRENTLPSKVKERLGQEVAEAFEEFLGLARKKHYPDRASAASIAQSWGAPRPEDAANGAGRQVAADARDLPLWKRELEPGDRIDERFTLERELGRGATATTYLVYDHEAERQVVLKSFDLDQVSVELAKQEFETLLGLNHDRIAVVRDRFRASRPYHLMIDFVPGQMVADVVDDFVGDAPTVARIATALLEGLSYLHGRGVIHRDISPRNVIVERDDPAELRIIDFGLATLMVEAVGSSGTPHFRAPEVEAGEPWTHAADVYSAGVMLYLLLCGAWPYELINHTPMKLVPRDVHPVADGALDLAALLRVAADPDPARRFPDAAAFLAALQRATTSEPEAGEPAPVDDGSEPGPSAPETADWYTTLFGDVPTQPHLELEPEPDLRAEAFEAEVPSSTLAVRAEAPSPSAAVSVPTAPRPPVGDPVSSSFEVVALEPARHRGNTGLGKGRARSYTLGGGGEVRARLATAGGERVLRLPGQTALAAAVNAAKDAGGEGPGGSFVVNEHGEVLVPTGTEVFLAATTTGLLGFPEGGGLVTAAPAAGLLPGEPWTGLKVGMRYLLTGDLSDVAYDHREHGRVWLSQTIGPAAAATVASGFGHRKRGGGRIHVNEAGSVFGPVQIEGDWIELYLGRIDSACWFTAGTDGSGP